jgi:hypothetical protein
MNKVVIKQTEEGSSISCIRGPVSKMTMVVKNKAGEQFYCTLQKKIFDSMPAGRPVEIFEKETLNSRKFMREYLEFVSNTEWNK